MTGKVNQNNIDTVNTRHKHYAGYDRAAIIYFLKSIILFSPKMFFYTF